jgi:hypothetical protein
MEISCLTNASRHCQIKSAVYKESLAEASLSRPLLGTV